MKYTELVIQLDDDKTSIYLKGTGVVLHEDSMIAFSKQGKHIKVNAVGNDAKQMIGKSSNWVESPIKSGCVFNPELAELMLKAFLEQAGIKTGFASKVKAIFLVNCALTNQERRAYEVLAINCGIDYVWFVPTLIATAIGADLDIEGVKGKMIVNLAHGFTEIGVISNCSLVKGYSIELGGNVVDSAICKAIFEQFNIVITDLQAHKIKNEIGSLHSSDIANIEIVGVDALTRVSKMTSVFAKDLYVVFKVAYEKIADAIKIVLRQLSADLSNDIATSGVYLSGLGSTVTGLENFFKKLIGREMIILDKIEQYDLASVKAPNSNVIASRIFFLLYLIKFIALSSISIITPFIGSIILIAAK